MYNESNQNLKITSQTEERVRAIWKSVLDSPDLGLHDNFLNLGGDSLSAMLCISRLRAEFGIEMTIEDFFFDQATVSNFAVIIDRSRVCSAGSI